MVYVLPSHDPVTGQVAPSSWGDDVNANFTFLNDMGQIFLFPNMDGLAASSGLTEAPKSTAQSSSGDTIKPEWDIVTFDDAGTKGRIWNAGLGRLYTVGNVINVAGSFYMAGANTDAEAVLVAQIAMLSSGDASAPAKSFDAVNKEIQNVPNAAGTERAFNITLTNDDGAAVLDRFSLAFYRTPLDGDDDAIGNLILTQLRVTFDLDS